MIQENEPLVTAAAALQERVENAFVSFRALFPGDAKNSSNSFIRALGNVLIRMRAALRENSGGENPLSRVPFPSGDGDVVDALNALTAETGAEPFARLLEHILLETLSQILPSCSPKVLEKPESDELFFLDHARNLAASFETLIPDFTAFLRTQTEQAKTANSIPGPARLRPSAELLKGKAALLSRLSSQALLFECVKRKTKDSDMFSSGRVFLYRHGVFSPVELKSVRPVSAFYGFRAARQMFLEHFGAFAAGKSNLPLLITSLPGLGKTQMTLAHSLHYPEITLILASPDDLSGGLGPLIDTLSSFPARKFMVFFDDIDAPSTNFYEFRTRVGGAFSLPENITITIASNQQFPANISSRGRGFIFPIFDEIRCQEMIEDFLISRGVRQPSGELISVIAADYVEEFGQKLFEELSPRTLVRYLEIYRASPEKRKKMLDSSKQDVITRPDPQVFYDENLKLMRSIYGDSILGDFQKKALHEI